MNLLIPRDVQFIIDTFYNNGFEAFLVGGCIRDFLLSKSPKDYDIATSAKPNDIVNLFSETIPTGIKHGTVTIMINNEGYETTTYRIEGTYIKNRKPDSVKFVTNIFEDLKRRDFTINAFAYNKKEGLKDFFNGQDDLKNKIIRAVGNPDIRFKEDALRMLRAIRFAAQLNFQVESNTYLAIQKNAPLISNISLERIRDEFSKILISSNPALGFNLLKETGLLEIIIEESTNLFDFNHTLSILQNTKPDLITRLATFFKDSSIEDTSSILSKLRFDNLTIKSVCLLVNEDLIFQKAPSRLEIKKLIRRVKVENLNYLFDLQYSIIKSLPSFEELGPVVLNTQILAEHILTSKEPINLNDLKINGKILIDNLNIKSGKFLGEILNYLLDQVLQNSSLNNKEILLELAKDYINKTS